MPSLENWGGGLKSLLWHAFRVSFTMYIHVCGLHIHVPSNHYIEAHTMYVAIYRHLQVHVRAYNDKLVWCKHNVFHISALRCLHVQLILLLKV